MPATITVVNSQTIIQAGENTVAALRYSQEAAAIRDYLEPFTDKVQALDPGTGLAFAVPDSEGFIGFQIDQEGNVRAAGTLEALGGIALSGVQHFEVVADAPFSFALIDAEGWAGEWHASDGSSGSEVAAARLTWAGALSDSGFTVAADIDTYGPGLTKLEVATDAGFADRAFISAPVMPFETAKSDTENYRSVKIAATDLRPDTTYYYRLVIDGAASPAQTLKTAPESGDFTFAFGSCHDLTATRALKTYPAIAALNPLFFLHLGDLFYSNIVGDDVRLQRVMNTRAARREFPDLAAFLTQFPFVYQFDNHDSAGGAQDDDTYPGTDYYTVVRNSRQAYRETVPHYPFALDSRGREIGNAFAFDIAAARFIVMDTVSFRSNANDVMLGDAQTEWLHDQLTSASGQGINQVFLCSPENWTTEGWAASWSVEQTALCDFIRDTPGLPPVTLLTGDMHYSAVDDGTNTDVSTGGGMTFFPQIMSSGLGSTAASQMGLHPFEWNGATSDFKTAVAGGLVNQFVVVTVLAAGGWTADIYGDPYTGATPTLLGSFASADI